MSESAPIFTCVFTPGEVGVDDNSIIPLFTLNEPVISISPFTSNNTSDEPDITNVFVPTVCLKDTKSGYGEELVPNEIFFPLNK